MIINEKDYSEIDRNEWEYSGIYIDKLDIPDRGYATVTNNMGLHFHEEKLRSGGFCGWCWLKDSRGEIVTDKNERKPVILHQECRFEEGLKAIKESAKKKKNPKESDYISAINNMISVIAKDEEFISYINFDSSDPDKRLFTF